MWSAITGLLSWWNIGKFMFLAIPVAFAWWNSNSADNLRAKLDKTKTHVELLEISLASRDQTISELEEDSIRSQTSISELQVRKKKAENERNNAWVAIGKFDDERKAYMQSKNLTPLEEDYVKCQTVPIPDSRKPDYQRVHEWW